MNKTQFNLTEFQNSDEIQKLKDLLRYEKVFLDFSYYSGFIIAAFNFNIFILSTIIYSQVGGYYLLKKTQSCDFFFREILEELP